MAFLCMLARTIDIARAMLPGGNTGEYQIGRGIQRSCFDQTGMDVPGLGRIVETAVGDEDVVRRLLKSGDAG